MRFNVGPLRYRLSISAGPVIVCRRRVLAACRERDRLIEIGPDAPPRNRMALLAHELGHAWIFATGEPSTVEGFCDLAALMAVSLLRDLSCQGGEEALMRLQPGESPEPGAARIALTTNRQCARCEGTIGGLSVVCSPSTTPGILDLAFHCEHCSHIQRWQEAVAASGFPSGITVGKPRFDLGAAVGEFLSLHSVETQ